MPLRAARSGSPGPLPSSIGHRTARPRERSRRARPVVARGPDSRVRQRLPRPENPTPRTPRSGRAHRSARITRSPAGRAPAAPGDRRGHRSGRLGGPGGTGPYRPAGGRGADRRRTPARTAARRLRGPAGGVALAAAPRRRGSARRPPGQPDRRAGQRRPDVLRDRPRAHRGAGRRCGARAAAPVLGGVRLRPSRVARRGHRDRHPGGPPRRPAARRPARRPPAAGAERRRHHPRDGRRAAHRARLRPEPAHRSRTARLPGRGPPRRHRRGLGPPGGRPAEPRRRPVPRHPRGAPPRPRTRAARHRVRARRAAHQAPCPRRHPRRAGARARRAALGHRRRLRLDRRRVDARPPVLPRGHRRTRRGARRPDRPQRRPARGARTARGPRPCPAGARRAAGAGRRLRRRRADRPGLLDACWDALPAGGRLVANTVTLESEALLADRYRRHGGELVRLAVSHAVPVGGFTGWRQAMPVTQWSVRKPHDSPGETS